jgi:GTPase
MNPLPERKACREFEAEVIILFHSTTMGPKYQAMVHSGVVRQTASIVAMEQDLLRTGDRAKVRFRFIRHPEYLRMGARLVFREGRTKGIGRITALFD